MDVVRIPELLGSFYNNARKFVISSPSLQNQNFILVNAGILGYCQLYLFCDEILEIAELCFLLSYCFNFVIYFSYDKKFRKACKDLFKLK